MESERGTTPFAYATPHSNAPYLPRSVGEVDVYEDEDDDADYFDEGTNNGADESSTDEDDVDDEGYEHNALSDYERDRNQRESASHGDWQGVQESKSGTYDMRYAGFVNQSFSNGHQDERQNEVDDDAASDISESPSEYPSTHPQIAKETHLPVLSSKVAKRTGLFERRRKHEKGFTIHVDEETEGA
jgi:hypothetical protein